MEAKRFISEFTENYLVSLKNDDNIREKLEFYRKRGPFWFEEFIKHLEDDFYEGLKQHSLEKYDEEIWENVIYPTYYDILEEIEAKLRDFAENLYKEFKE
jgi:uncharacterized protein YaaR (DUF327 family)